MLLSAFVSLLIGTVALAAVLLIRHEERAVHEVLEQVAGRAHAELRGEIVAMLRQPDITNRHVSRALEAGRVNVDDEAAVYRLLHDAPRRDDGRAVSAVYLGLPDGTFLGYGADTFRWPPTGWRFSYAGPAADGHFEFREALPDGRAGEPIGRLGLYDARERPWYRRAESTLSASWTTLYRNYEDESLKLTRVWPWRDESGELLGVVGTDVYLRHFQQFLDARALGESGEAFVVQRNGTLVAATGTRIDFRSLRPLTAADAAPYRFVRAAALAMQSEYGTLADPYVDLREHRELDGEYGYLLLSPVARDAGLDWTIGVFLPERDYVEGIPSRYLPLLPLATLVLAVALLVFTAFVSLVVRPLRELRDGARRIAVGEFDVPIRIDSRNEVGDLARAIDEMQTSLRESFAVLDTERSTLATTLEAIEDGVIMTDEDGKLRYLNRMAADVTGVDRDALPRADIGSLFRLGTSASRRAVTFEDLLRLARDRRADARCVTVVDALGMPHDVRLRAVSIAGGGDEGPGLVLNFTVLSRIGSDPDGARAPDPLDDVLVRSAFEHDVARLVAGARLDGTRHAIAMLEFDEPESDSPPQAPGRDRWARGVAATLLGMDDRRALVSRFEAHLFAVALPYRTLEDARRMLHALHRRLARHAGGGGLSVGLVEIDDRSFDADERLRLALADCRRTRDSDNIRTDLSTAIPQRL